MKKRSERNARLKIKQDDLRGKSAARRKKNARQRGSKPAMKDIENVKRRERSAKLDMSGKETMREIVAEIVTVIAIDLETETETRREFLADEIHMWSGRMTRKRKLPRPNRTWKRLHLNCC